MILPQGNHVLQEAMENFVFPDEIKTKLMNLMKMNKLMKIFTFPKLMGKGSKLYFFL